MKRILTCLALLVLTVVLAVSVSAATVEIGTADALIKLMSGTDASYPWTGDYVLTADIDLTGKTGQKPIGNGTTKFSGTFDGDGYTISGLQLDMSTTNHVGLFGKIGGGAVIENLTVEGTVKGKQYVGGIVGSVGVSGNAGVDTATIRNCHNHCDVTATYQVGGVVGYIHGPDTASNGTKSATLTGCWNSGSITATRDSQVDVGGVVGILWGVGEVSNCWNTGSVTATSTGTGATCVGGLYGRSYSYAKISNSYSSAVVTTKATTNVGAFVGNNANATFVNCYYNAKDFDSKSTLTSGHADVLGFSNTAAIYAKLGDAWEGTERPRLKAMTVRIQDEEDLLNLMNSPSLWKANVVLENDITLTAANKAKQKPIGDTSSDAIGTYFTGSFDGGIYDSTGNLTGKHSISGLAIVGTAANTGFFGVVEGATIKNLTISGSVSAAGYEKVGGLIGQLRTFGVVENCTVNCTVDGARLVGGFVGLVTLTDGDEATFIDVVNTGNVSAKSTTTASAKTGGIIGSCNSGKGKLTVLRAYNSGAISGVNFLGGIVGEIAGSDTASSGTTNYTIVECKNEGKISSTSTDKAISGGLFGYLKGAGKVSDCMNSGNVECKGPRAGGFVGQASGYVNVSYCYADCTVTAPAGVTYVRAFCGIPEAKGFHSNYYNSAKCSAEATNTSEFEAAGGEVPTAYTELLFDKLNTNNAWVIASAPELSVYHKHDYTKGFYVDNGDGTHSRGCACGEAETGASSEAHSFNDEGGCTKCDGAIELTEIETAEDLLKLMKYTRLWAEGSFKLMNDIDLADYTGTAYTQRPIGTVDNPFRGTFEGQDHTISGLALDVDGNHVGLFGAVGSGASISDLTVAGSVKGNNYVGGIVGIVGGTSDAKGVAASITNCTNACTVSGAARVGGIVGYFNGDRTAASVLTDCINTGAVTATGDSVGGVAGILWDVMTVDRVGNAAAVTGADDEVGGIVGRTAGKVNISNAENSGKISGVNSVGGIIGSVGNKENGSSVVIDTPMNSGSVSGIQSVGGVVGYFHGMGVTTSTLTDAANSGSIASQNVTGADGTITGGNDVGGIVGALWLGAVSEATNTGTITGAGSHVGGIVGRTAGISTVTKATNNGAVIGIVSEYQDAKDKTVMVGGNYLGGIVGSVGNAKENAPSAATVSDCVNHVDISGRERIGGVVGYFRGSADTSVLNNCTNNGAISTTTANDVGGITGIAWNLKEISACKNTGAITSASANAGGIVGRMTGTVTVTGCTNTGAVTTTGNDAGGIVGQMMNGNLVVSANTNTAAVSGKNAAGGIVGDACARTDSTTKYTDSVLITENVNSGVVSGGQYVAGIIGLIRDESGYVKAMETGKTATLSKNSNAAGVTGDKYVGGIVGAFRGGDTKDSVTCSIIECQNSGKIVSVATTTGDGGADVGGIAGMLYAVGNVNSCANFGDVETNLPWAGGFVGRTASGTYTTISNCFVSCTVTASKADTNSVRAFCGHPLVKRFQDCYYDSTKCAVEATNTSDFTNVGGTPPTAYAAFLFDALNGSGKWVKMTLPELAIFHTEHDNTLGGVDQGNGTHIPECPCGEEAGSTPVAHTYIGRTGVCICGAEYTVDWTEIDSVDKLLILMNNATLWGGDYTLSADIDLKNKTAYPIGGWVEDSGSSVLVPFTGTFNGNGHQIKNLNLSGEKHVALFGLVTGTAADPAKISNLTVSGTIDATGSYAAGVVAYAGTRDSSDSAVTIENCYNKCKVNGINYVGGIVGYFVGSDTGSSTNSVLSNCFNSGAITATTAKAADVGGIVGILWNIGDVNNCYASGKVTTSGPNTGGIVGRMYNYVNIRNSYANAVVVSSEGDVSSVRAFCGNPQYTYGITACYYNSAKTAEESNAIGIRDYTAEHFDTLNADGLWVALAQPVLKDYHTSHKYTLYVDNGNGTHTPMCPCGTMQTATAAEHTPDGNGICTLCGNADGCRHFNTEVYVDGTPNCQTGAQKYTRCTLCLTQIGEATEIPANPNAHSGAWESNGDDMQYVCTVSGCGEVLKTVAKSDFAEIYVSSTGKGDGSSASAPMNDFGAAMALAAAIPDGTVTIYIIDEAIIPVPSSATSYFAYEEPAHTSKIVISGYSGEQAVFKFADVDAKMFYLLSGPTEFRNVEFSTWDNSSYMYLVGRHNPLIIGESVTSDYHRVANSSSAHSGNIYIIGGCFETLFSEDCGDKGSYVELHSGSFRTVVGGSFDGSCCTSGTVELKFFGDVTVRQQVYAGSYNGSNGNIEITVGGNLAVGTVFSFGSVGTSKKAKDITLYIVGGSISTGTFSADAIDAIPVGSTAATIKLLQKMESFTAYTDTSSPAAMALHKMLSGVIMTMYGADEYNGKVQFLLMEKDNYCAVAGGKHKPQGDAPIRTEASTCVVQGRDIYFCTECTQEYSETLPLAGHTYTKQAETLAATCMAPAMQYNTCDECNATIYTATGDAPLDASVYANHTDPEKTGFCQICNKDITKLCNHTVVETENITAGCATGKKITCTECGMAEVKIASTNGGHNFGAYTVTKEPTATMAGVKTRTCKGCGKVETAVINASGDAINAGALATDANGNLADFDVAASKLSKVEKKALDALLQKDAYGSEVKVSYETDGDVVTNVTYRIPVPAEYTKYENVMIVVKDERGNLHFVDFKIQKGYIVFEF